jgi:tRNA(Ile)-lysidine synthase
MSDLTPDQTAGPSVDEVASRVEEFIAAHQVLEPGEDVLALVSGGADSLCLWGVLKEIGYPVEALHVEHGLRGQEGLADAAHCAGLGAAVVPVDLEDGPNLEARARAARYAAAREHAAGRTIATGHTLSDQAETVVYRLVSSSGVRAVRAMRPRAGEIARPLLGLTASETRAWCASRGVVPRRDSTNDDRARRRNLIRHEVMPALRRVHPGAEVNLARTAELLGELDELLAELAGGHVTERFDLDSLEELPRALRVLVLREAAERVAGRPLRMPRQLTDRLVAMTERRGGVERLSLGADLEAVRDRGSLSFAQPARYPARDER